MIRHAPPRQHFFDMVPVHGHLSPAQQQQQQLAFFDNNTNPKQQLVNHGSHTLAQVPDLMSSDSAWLGQPHQQTVPRAHRLGHQRESSLSSLGSNGPASPYNASTSNPQIAVTDSVNDGYHDLSGTDGNYSYQLNTKGLPDNLFLDTPLSTAFNGAQPTPGDVVIGRDDAASLPLAFAQRPRSNPGGLSDISVGGSSSSHSHPISVASSAAGDDSPATPSMHELEDEARPHKSGTSDPSWYYRSREMFACLHIPGTTGLNSLVPQGACNDAPQSSSNLTHERTTGATNVPKLDRTMTDVYGDELYNPNFSYTTAPQAELPLAVSPRNDLFTQTVNAANTQHLNAGQSPGSSISRERSPFTQGSPFSASMSGLPSQPMADQSHHVAAQRQIEHSTAGRGATEDPQLHMASASTQSHGTPSTISPKDAMLDLKESDDTANFPLFPATDSTALGVEQLANGLDSAKALPQHSTSSFAPMSLTSPSFNFSVPTPISMPPQYSYVSRPRQHQMMPANPAFPRLGSDDNSGTSVSSPQRPPRTNADGGTYTCTYHGCTMRFETPALLQKHKREGHRQVNALNTMRHTTPSVDGPPAAGMVDTQAGPHKCDRLNPTTGKPCNTVFSRPYDLTRHEDTIHNARKQKVRCDLCDEEKTFSRADALTRHYRVCHPDHEVPGKQRRRAA